MASISAVRDGLKARLATISGLRAHDVWPGQVVPPAALVQPTGGNYEVVLADDALLRFDIVVAVQLSEMRSAQDKLDAYLSNTGASSIKEAIEADRTLGGVASSLSVKGFRDYGDIEINKKTYLGAFIEVEVLVQ